MRGKYFPHDWARNVKNLLTLLHLLWKNSSLLCGYPVYCPQGMYYEPILVLLRKLFRNNKIFLIRKNSSRKKLPHYAVRLIRRGGMCVEPILVLLLRKLSRNNKSFLIQKNSMRKASPFRMRKLYVIRLEMCFTHSTTTEENFSKE